MAIQKGLARRTPASAPSSRRAPGRDEIDDLEAVDSMETPMEPARKKSVPAWGWSVSLVLIAGSTAIIAYTVYVFMTL